MPVITKATFPRFSSIENIDTDDFIVVDEADRLQMNSLEQMRSIFDEVGLAWS